ncbi:MAG: flagellar biosynthesis protein FlhF [Gallionella sp.]
MNIRKFIAPTARQALKNIRSELGDEAVILSNRKVGDGVEIIALANEEITRFTDTLARKNFHGSSQKMHAEQHSPVAQASPAAAETSILGEIKSMHSMLQQQLAELSWSGVQQRDPLAAGLLRNMLNSGFSAQLARQFMERMPGGKPRGAAWINQVLKRNLRVVGEQDDIIVKGGVYALIGPTGVGKTTTTAKLAARAVVRYGADKVALLTTDSFRIGAFEQLKIYGRILGVEVHAVKGAEDLRLTISALRSKHLVLIDTAGMGQRDERVGEQREMFDAVGVPRLLLLNSAGGGNTLDDVVRMYHSEMVIGCIPTKLDEAVNLGSLLDVLVRHQLVLHYMTNGQCVPEDLHPVNLDYLLHRAFKHAEQKNSFTLRDMEFPALMAGEGSFVAQTWGMQAEGRTPETRDAGIMVPKQAGYTKGRDASYAL